MKKMNRRASVSEGVANNNLRSRELITGMNRNKKSDDRVTSNKERGGGESSVKR